jgi:N6-adenosine-specific RNA methylase IME4
MTAFDEFIGLRPQGGFKAILADPPWRFALRSEKGEEKSPQAHYGCVDWETLAMLPVSALAAPHCLLFMWATFPMLREALAVMDGWGFRYVTGGAWHKKTVHGKTAFGTGYVLRSASEPFLIGALGQPAIHSRSERNLIEALAREHSRKPDEQYGLMERLAGEGARIELFARQRMPGWQAWGNEVGKFDIEATATEEA